MFAKLSGISLAVLLVGCAPTADIPGPVTPAHGSDGTLFVANKRGASLSRIDLATGEETHRADTCENPHELTVSPDDALVMVACYSGRSVEIYATEDLRQIADIPLGEQARVHSALWLENFNVVAGAEGRGSLYIVETMETDEPRPIEIGGGGPGPHMIAVDQERGLGFGTIIPTGEVVRYDLNMRQEVLRRRIGDQIEALALSPDGLTLWVSSNVDSIAYRLDAETLEVQAEVPTGQVPIRLAMHPSGDFVVSSNYGSGDLTVIDTATDEVVRTIPVSGSSDAVQVTLVFSEDGSRLYAAETATDTIAEIDFASGEVLRRIRTGPGGDGLAVID
ncbi:beta-propeller fold lactonase family protein [Aurantiacibacter sp. MUD61]|uniref:beta-propeller fold lactonase family protein n=1 Tax=Aurantiacibacter sp. MUD61 TaxID=3009083 RepID=UPI0022F0D1B6|nr:beta-propeller fold lactonase family protein [Aurantiacibacter sp. MUD61]